jgi:hypothetical protein
MKTPKTSKTKRKDNKKRNKKLIYKKEKLEEIYDKIDEVMDIHDEIRKQLKKIIKVEDSESESEESETPSGSSSDDSDESNSDNSESDGEENESELKPVLKKQKTITEKKNPSVEKKNTNQVVKISDWIKAEEGKNQASSDKIIEETTKKDVNQQEVNPVKVIIDEVIDSFNTPKKTELVQIITNDSPIKAQEEENIVVSVKENSTPPPTPVDLSEKQE